MNISTKPPLHSNNHVNEHYNTWIFLHSHQTLHEWTLQKITSWDGSNIIYKNINYPRLRPQEHKPPSSGNRLDSMWTYISLISTVHGICTTDTSPHHDHYITSRHKHNNTTPRNCVLSKCACITRTMYLYVKIHNCTYCVMGDQLLSGWIRLRLCVWLYVCWYTVCFTR